MTEDRYSLSEILSDRDFPFSILALFFTAPINLIFLFGLMFASSPFNYNGLINLIPLPFVILNFGITLCFGFIGLVNREFSGDCF